mmetsp:Transcript_143047/g.266656  ORF Transcript_143047/g.266656 Transcript_143047/m.266656 type:complete len:81 (-) Transcript_143047:38-280(-)
MPMHFLELLTTGDVPEAQGAIAGAGERSISWPRRFDAGNPAGVPPELPDNFTTLQIPDHHVTVMAPAECTSRRPIHYNIP